MLDKRWLVAAMMFLVGSNGCYGSAENVSSSFGPYVEIRTSDTAKTLTLYFSLGCFHCLRFLDRGMSWMDRKLDEKQLNIRFLEIPGMMPRWGNRTEQAINNSRLATRYTQCIASEKGAYAYLESLNQITQLAKENVRLHLSKGSELDWSWYAYARNNEVGGGFSSVQELLKHVLDLAGVDERKCGDEVLKRYEADAKSYYERIKSTPEFPVFRFDGKSYLSGDLRELVSDIEASILESGLERARKDAWMLQQEIREEKVSILLLISQGLLEDEKFEEGLEALREAIDMGSAEAMYRLGSAYWSGSYGLPQDDRQGFTWTRKAAKGGHKAAMYDVYRFYTLGKGTDKDSREAHAWLKRSVENGNRKAAFALAQDYQYGLGARKNPLVALAWFRVAEAAGEKRASETLQQPEQQMLIQKTLFRGCPDCPEMVVVPESVFLMGVYRDDGKYRYMRTGIISQPRHLVNFAEAFAVGRFEVTNRNWDACVKERGCRALARPDSSKADEQPRAGVSWNDAIQYVGWLKKKTGKPYRLLTESEWEYIARAGMMTDFHWGDRQGEALVNCGNCGSRWDGVSTAPVGSFPANGFNIFDTHGNVAEWVQDCLNADYKDKPPRGKAWEEGQCDQRMVRGGAWNQEAGFMRSYERAAYPVATRLNTIGLRVALSLPARRAGPDFMTALEDMAKSAGKMAVPLHGRKTIMSPPFFPQFPVRKPVTWEKP